MKTKFRVRYAGTWCIIDLNEGLTDEGYATYMECVERGEEFYQYIGLKDKNGKEIYKGDIVDGLDELAEIQWDDDTARYIIAMGNVIYDFDNTYPRELEVIGDTCENPELLKEE